MRRLNLLRHHAPWLGLVTLMVFYLYGSLISGVFTITHEGFSLYVRIQQFLQELLAGYPQPMLFPDAVRHGGIAFPAFYPPVSYYVTAALAWTGKSVLLGVNVSLFLSVLASALACYACSVEISRRRAVALAATAIYVTVTYRFVDVYVRGALAESWSFVWYPLIVLGALRELHRRPYGWLLPVGIAGAVTTHTITAIYFLVMAGLLMCCVLAAGRQWRAIPRMALLCALGLGMGAWYLLPQQSLLKDVWASDRNFFWSSIENFERHRVLFAQLFHDDPDHWFGNSYGLDKIDEFCFNLGLGHLVALGVLVYALGNWRALRSANSRERLALAASAFAMWGVGIVFLLKPSLILRWLPGFFGYMQFPLRMLGILPIFAVLFFCVAVRPLVSRRSQGWLVVVALVLVAEVPYFATTRRLKLDVTKTTLTSDYAASKGDMGYTEQNEYMPKSYPIQQAGSFFLTAPLFRNCRMERWQRTGYDRYELVAEAPAQDGAVIVPLVAYPFWQAKSASVQEIPLSQDQGYLRLALPAGRS
jgi:hypothetical protein